MHNTVLVNNIIKERKNIKPTLYCLLLGQQTPIFACAKNEAEFSSSYCRQLPQPTPYPRHCNVIDCPPE